MSRCSTPVSHTCKVSFPCECRVSPLIWKAPSRKLRGHFLRILINFYRSENERKSQSLFRPRALQPPSGAPRSRSRSPPSLRCGRSSSSVPGPWTHGPDGDHRCRGGSGLRRGTRDGKCPHWSLQRRRQQQQQHSRASQTRVPGASAPGPCSRSARTLSFRGEAVPGLCHYPDRPQSVRRLRRGSQTVQVLPRCDVARLRISASPDQSSLC